MLDQTVREGGFSMIDVGDDAEVSNTWHFGLLFLHLENDTGTGPKAPQFRRHPVSNGTGAKHVTP
jgi:hypothetical protein